MAGLISQVQIFRKFWVQLRAMSKLTKEQKKAMAKLDSWVQDKFGGSGNPEADDCLDFSGGLIISSI